MKRFLKTIFFGGLLTFLVGYGLSEIWTVKDSNTATAQMTDGQKLLVFEAVGTETLSVGTVTTSVFDSSIYSTTSGKQTHRAYFSVEANDIRYWYHGQAPTTTLGHKVTAGESGQIVGLVNIMNTKMSSTSGTATVFVTYERVREARR